MTRKLLSVVIAALLVVGFASFMTKADVTGSFTANIYVNPVDCGAFPFISFSPTPVVYPVYCENTIPKIDFETGLIVNWTVSGLTLGLNTMAGFTGFEHILTSLKATLGALNITDNFFFAVPFGVDVLTIHNANSTQTDTETAWTVIQPGNLLFVKKIVNISISIAGITLTNLAEIGDFTFPMGPNSYPCAESFGGKCPLLPAQANYAANGYSAASQTFAFGDALTISGQTVSGITVTNTTGVNLNPNKYESFKKISFKGWLCQGVGETISVVGIPVASGITANEKLVFNLGAAGLVGPGTLPVCGTTPFTATTTLNLATALGNITAIFSSSLPISTFFNGAIVTFSSGALSLLADFDATLALVDVQATLDATLNPDSNPASLSLTAILCQKAGVGLSGYLCGAPGLNEIDASLSVQRSGLTFTVNTALVGAGTVTLDTLEFVVDAQAGAVNIGADITVLPAWAGVFSFGINF